MSFDPANPSGEFKFWLSKWLSDPINKPPVVTPSGTTAARPTVHPLGYMYYDTTLGKPIWWNGSVWKDATGSTV